MAQPYKFLQVSVKVFRVLAWLALAVQVVTGFILLIVGGDPVVIGGLDLPARLVGVLNFAAAGLYFFMFWLSGSLIQLGLDIRTHLPGGEVSH